MTKTTKGFINGFRADFTEKLKDRKRAESYVNAILQETRYGNPRLNTYLAMQNALFSKR